jgi:hypothetical protein
VTDEKNLIRSEPQAIQARGTAELYRDLLRFAQTISDQSQSGIACPSPWSERVRVKRNVFSRHEAESQLKLSHITGPIANDVFKTITPSSVRLPRALHRFHN